MIREVTDKDALAIAKIYNYYIKNTVITFEQDVVDSINFINRINKIKSTDYSWLVAVENNEVIGYAYSSKWNDRAAYEKTAEISVYLSHEGLSKGWGTKLYEELFSTLLKKKIHIVIAGITLPNKASIAIHEKFGMEKVAHFKEVGFKFGQWLDVGYWQVNLNA